MKIAFVVAGSGTAYCGTCAQHVGLVRALRRLGFDATLLSVYLPVESEDNSTLEQQVAFGGLSAYLAQVWPGLNLPDWITALLDQPFLLNLMGRFSTSTSPRKLGPMTVSMLRGLQGRQKRQVEQLLQLLEQLRPDCVHFSTALLLGLAEAVQKRLSIPVACSISGEQGFIDELPTRYRTEAKTLLAQLLKKVSLAIVPSYAYAEHCAEYFGVDRSLYQVVEPAIDLTAYPAKGKSKLEANEHARPLKVGWLGRIIPHKGLELLADAAEWLLRTSAIGTRCLEVNIAGAAEGPERMRLRKVLRRLNSFPSVSTARYWGRLSHEQKVSFLAAQDVLVVTSLVPECRALTILEAWACRTAVVAPDCGTPRELVNETGAGLLYRCGDANSLAQTLSYLVLDRNRVAEAADLGRRAIEQRFNLDVAANKLVQLYRNALAR